MMGFMDALNNMILGKRMTRPAYTGSYLMIMPGQSYIWLVGNTSSSSTPNVVTYIANIDDIFASDWMIKL